MQGEEHSEQLHIKNISSAVSWEHVSVQKQLLSQRYHQSSSHSARRGPALHGFLERTLIQSMGWIGLDWKMSRPTTEHVLLLHKATVLNDLEAVRKVISRFLVKAECHMVQENISTIT